MNLRNISDNFTRSLDTVNKDNAKKYLDVIKGSVGALNALERAQKLTRGSVKKSHSEDVIIQAPFNLFGNSFTIIARFSGGCEIPDAVAIEGAE